MTTDFLSPDKMDYEARKSTDLYGWHGKLVTTPSGSCPVKLKDTSEQGVKLWVNEVIVEGHSRNVHYAPSALRYWAAQMFDRSSSEYKEVCEDIGKVFELSEQPVAPKKESSKPRPSAEKLVQDLGTLCAESPTNEIDMPQ